MCLIGRTQHCSRAAKQHSSMTRISSIVLVCTISIIFNPTSSQAVAEGESSEELSKNNILNESECNEKLVKNIFHAFANIPNGFDPNEDPQLKIDETNNNNKKKPSVICWTHIVTTMKNNVGDTIDKISEYAISFETPKNPAYNYVINSDPDVFGNTRTFFISPPEIIYRNKDHIAEKKKYITCNFSSQYHKSYNELPDGHVEMQIVKDNQKPETEKLVENCVDKELVTEQAMTAEEPAGIIDLIMKPNRARHEIVKKDKPVVEEIPTTVKQFNDYDTSDETTQSGMLSGNVPNNNKRESNENVEDYLQQINDLIADIASRETTEANTYTSTTNEDIDLLPFRRKEITEKYYNTGIPEETTVYPEMYTSTTSPVPGRNEISSTEEPSVDSFLVKMIKFNILDDENNIIEKCLEIDGHVSVTNCPSEALLLPTINETALPNSVSFNLLQDIPDLDDDKLLVRGDLFCYILNKITAVPCPSGESELVTILEMDIQEPISVTTQEPLEWETPAENTAVEMTTVPAPEAFTLRLANVKIDNSGNNNSLTLTCNFIDRNIYELTCPSDMTDIPYFDENLFPEYVEIYHIDELPTLTDNMLLFRGNKKCYILNVVTMAKCPTDTTKVLTLPILESKSQHTKPNRKNVTSVTVDSDESNDEIEDDCDYVSSEEGITDKATTPSNESRHFLVRFIDIISFDKIAITCYNVDKYISLLNCPENTDEIPEFDVRKLPDDTIISDETDKPILLRGNQMIVKGKGHCYALTKFNMKKCPKDGNRRMLNVIDCKIDSDPLESLDTEPISNLENLLNRNFPILHEITHISQRPDIPTYTTVTCENVKNNIGIVNCPTGFSKTSIINETLLSEYPKYMHTNMSEHNDENTLMAQGKKICYIFEKTGETDCPKDLKNVVRLNTYAVIDNKEDRSSTEYLQNIETVTSQYHETTTEVMTASRETTEETDENNTFPVALQVLNISPQSNIPSYLKTTCKRINRTIFNVNCHTGFQQIPIINDKLLSKYARQIISKNISEFSNSMLLVRGNKYCYILDQVGSIDCPDNMNEIMKVLIKRVVKPEETMMTLTTSRPTEEKTTIGMEYLSDIETGTNQLDETTTEMIPTSCETIKETVPPEDENNVFPVALQALRISPDSNIPSYITITCENINSSVSIIHCPAGFKHIPVIKDELLAKYAKQITHKHNLEFSDHMLLVRSIENCYIFDKAGPVDCPEDLNGMIKIRPEESLDSTEYLHEIETVTNELPETTAEITSTTSRPTKNKFEKFLEYLQEIETAAKELYGTTAQISSTTSKPTEGLPRTSTEYWQDVDSGTYTVNEAAAEITTTSSRPTENKFEKFLEYLQDIENAAKDLYGTTAQISSTTSKPTEELPRTTTEYRPDADSGTYTRNEAAAEITTTSSRPTEEKIRTSTEYLQNIETSTRKLHEITAEIISTTSRPAENKFEKFLEYLQEIETAAKELYGTTAQISSTTSKPTEELPRTTTEYRQDVDSGTYTLNEAAAEITTTSSRPTEEKVRTSTEYLQDIETSTRKLHETTAEITSTTSKPTEDNIRTFTEYRQDIETSTTKFNETPMEVTSTSSGTLKETEENNTFPVALQVLNISPDSNIPSHLTITCENINSSVSVIHCPAGLKHIPVIKDELLAKYAKQITHKHNLEFSDNMLLVRSKKNCYIFDKVGQVDCPEDLNDIIKIFTRRAIRPQESLVSTEYLQDIETVTKELHGTTAEIASTASRATEENPITSTEYLQNIETDTNKLPDITAEITSITNRLTQEKVRTSTENLQDIETGTKKMHETTAEITSTTSIPTEWKHKTSTEYLQAIETGTHKIITAEITSTTSRPTEWKPLTSTEYLQNIKTDTHRLHDTTAEITSTTSLPSEWQPVTSKEYLQNIETDTHKLHDTTPEITSTTRLPSEWQPVTSTEYLQNIETDTHKLPDTTAEITSTTSRSTKEQSETVIEYLKNIETGTYKMHDTAAEITSTTNIPVEWKPKTSTGYPQNIDTGTHELHETAAETISTTSRPTEEEGRTFSENLQDIKTGTNKLHDTTAEITSTTRLPTEWQPITSTEYLQNTQQTDTNRLHESTAEITSTTSRPTQEQSETVTEYLKNIETGTYKMHDTIAEITSTSSIPTEWKPKTSTGYLQTIETTAEITSTTSVPTEEKSDTVTEYLKDTETGTYKLHETTAEIMSSGTTEETEPVDGKNNFPVTLQVLHVSPQGDVPSYLTGTCELINSSIANIDCPTGNVHIPVIKDEQLSTFAKEIIYKNISEFSDSMLVVRGKTGCYILDRIGPTDLCWESQDDIIHIFTKEIIGAKKSATTRNHLKTNETDANELHETAAEIIDKDQITSTIAGTVSLQNISTPSPSYTYEEAVTTEKTENDAHDEISTDIKNPVTEHRVPEYLHDNNIRAYRRFNYMPLKQQIISDNNNIHKGSIFPVKIYNVFGPNNTQVVCKYVDKNVKLINTSTEILNLPFIINAYLPMDVKFEYMTELPHVMGNNHLLVRGTRYYYLLKEFDTFECPKNTENFVPITMYYAIGTDYHSHNDTIRKTTTIRRVKRNKAKTTVKGYVPEGIYSMKMHFIGTGYNETVCAYVERYMTVVDGARRPTKLRIDRLPQTRFYFDNRAPVEMTENKLGMRAEGVWYIYHGYEEFDCPNDTMFYIPRTVYYRKSEVPYFNAKVVNIPKPNVIHITCKIMQITELDSPPVLGNVPFIDIPLLPDNIIIKYRKYYPEMVHNKSVLVQYVYTYYLLEEHKPIKCPKNTDKFLPVVIIANDESFFKEKDEIDDEPVGRSDLVPDVSNKPQENVQTTVDSPETSEIFEPGNGDDELSVIPLVQQTSNRAVLSTTPLSSVISKSTAGPLLPSPAHLNSVIVKYNNAENEEECYEVNSHMHVNKIPCPQDTSMIPKVINPEFIKLLCPKKLRPKFKYMNGLGILRKLNMIIHEPAKQKNASSITVNKRN